MPREPVRKIRFRGEVEYQDQADAVTRSAGDTAVVVRGRPRSLVMACPDGCGERLIINLDPRTGAAWRLYQRRGQLSLFPSVWRDSGCGSHFILWSDHILWCSSEDDYGPEPAFDDGPLRDLVLSELGHRLKPFADIAEALGGIPWEVLDVCRQLVRRGLALEGLGSDRGCFRRRN
jgi:hypothetical protein